MDCEDYIVAGISILLTGIGAYFAFRATKVSERLLGQYNKDRREDFGAGIRIQKIERKENSADRFTVTIKNENNIKRIGIHKITVTNREDLITHLYTVEELNDKTRYIEAGGIEKFEMLPAAQEHWSNFSPLPCVFTVVDTNGKRDDATLKSLGVGKALYEAKS